MCVMMLWNYVVVVCVFFFQADDGIRVLTVTGVQTCALPIWTPCRGCPRRPPRRRRSRWPGRCPSAASGCSTPRSEERRVGKSSVDLGGRRIIKKKKKKQIQEDRRQKGAVETHRESSMMV